MDKQEKKNLYTRLEKISNMVSEAFIMFGIEPEKSKQKIDEAHLDLIVLKRQIDPDRWHEDLIKAYNKNLKA